jgi:casein kinase I family protein HRR25
MGAGKRQNVLHVIDFGLAKKYRYPKTGEHIPHKEGKSLTGTARYASINTHIGLEQSRRDDLEAIGYVLIYFLNGLLPWQGLKGKDDKQQNKQERYDLIMQKKISTSIEELCHGLPEEFVLYMKYVRKLKFEEEPKYGRIRQLFRDIFVKYEYVYDYKFDWQLVREKEERARIQKMGMQ